MPTEIGKGPRKRTILVEKYRTGGASEVARAIGRGVRGQWNWKWHHFVRWSKEYANDRRLGIHTRGRDKSHEDHGRGIYGYQAAHSRDVSQAFDKLGVEPRDFTFIDLGCGKGTALFMALEAGFRRVIGVELIPGFLESAERNLRRFEKRHGRNARHRAELLLGDAASYQPPLEPTVFFLSNPFGEQTMRSVIARMEESLNDNPRPIHVIYHTPIHEEIIAESPVLHLALRQDKWVIYSNME